MKSYKKQTQINNTVESEEFQWDVVDKLKGLHVLILGLESAEDMGQHVYQKCAYTVLADIVKKLIDESITYQEVIAELATENHQNPTANININVGVEQ